MLDSEETLVQRAKAGDRAAFEDLVRRVSRLVFARLYLETGDSHAAEDLLQETFLTAFRSLDQLTDASKFRAWLLRIAQNQAIDAARRGGRLKRHGLALARPEAVPPPEEDAQKQELRQK